jgi:hypothetical protein
MIIEVSYLLGCSQSCVIELAVTVRPNLEPLLIGRPLGYEADGTCPTPLLGSCCVLSSQGRLSMASPSSSRSDRCPQRPYYRFYYGRLGIVAYNSARLPSPRGCWWSRSGGAGLVGDLVDRGAGPRPVAGRVTVPRC